MVFFDYLLLEVSTLITVCYFLYIFNITLLLFAAGVYLILIGVLSMLKDLDVYVGFLWVIDLGVGLIFFIFTLHFNTFLNQKSVFNVSSKHFFTSILLLFFFISYFYFFSRANDFETNLDLNKIWFLDITYCDLYKVLFSTEANVLLAIKYSYFTCNSFEFFLINYSLFFGIVASILLFFLIKRLYVKLILSQGTELNSLEHINSATFIRNQNFIFQQNVHQSTRIWTKKKNK